MEWLDRMNDALGYLEANLAGTADMEHAARLACCSVYHFGRMFSYIAGVPLSEYLRRRRMTLAAFDLQNGGRVLDVALRYGYESPTAFNRAFQSVHGVSPSAAQRDGAPLKAYPRISFKITVKGEAEMDYRIIKQEAFRIVGVREPLLPDFEDSFRRVPEFWGEAAARRSTAEKGAVRCRAENVRTVCCSGPFWRRCWPWRLLPGGGCGACTATRPVRRSWRGKCSRRPCLLPVRARRAQTGRKCPPMLALWTLRRCAGIIRP